MPASADPFLFLADGANRNAFPEEIRKSIIARKLVMTPSPHRRHYHRTLLHLAVWADNRAAAMCLLDLGADVNKLDDLHDSPFLLAGAEGRRVILEAMLDSAIRVVKFGSETSRRLNTIVPNFAVVNRFGGSALIPACERGHVECVRLLLEKSAVDVNHMNYYHLTGLLEVVELGGDDRDHVRITQLLIKYGADVNLTNAEGKTALRIAKEKKFKRIASLLLTAGGHA